jgi:hypothetical protein
MTLTAVYLINERTVLEVLESDHGATLLLHGDDDVARNLQYIDLMPD